MSTPLTPPKLTVPSVDGSDEGGTCAIDGCPADPIVETGYRLCGEHAFDGGLP